MDETINECLSQLRACELEHDELLMVAAIIKDNGGSQNDFSAWFGETKTINNQRMAAHWRSIKGSNHPVGIGTLVKLCRDHGGQIDTHPQDDDPGHELSWDAEIGGNEKKKNDYKIVKQDWLQDESLPPEDEVWDGVADLKRYLSTLFNMEEHVGYVTDSWESKDKNGEVKHMPNKGSFDRTAGQLCQALDKCGGDIGSVIGDCKPEVGAWIRFNPLDGQGVKDANVTAHRFALVESDDATVENQYATYKQLELPIAALVHSGGRSLHAIVRIDAPDYKEYQKRVDFLFEVCRKNGLKIDKQNKNPSRLSRLPGVLRNGNRQWLVATNIGKSSWQEWSEFISAVNDDLPDIECLSDFMGKNLPQLNPPLIDGVLRCGHKLMITGPANAGKSLALLQLAIAITEGRRWFGWQCVRGGVLYVNLELDRASCYHRVNDLYVAMGIQPKHSGELDIWHLRGQALPMTELAPKLIRRSLKKRYSAIIIDPIYKTLTGDENAAHEMAKFCNQFDKVCAELRCAVIYCHHHSKGEQGGKEAADRGSGSGVFKRDPDALMDIIQIEAPDTTKKQLANKWECEAMAKEFDSRLPGWRDHISQDDAVVADKLAKHAMACGMEDAMRTARHPATLAAELATAWMIECGTLREFAKFKPKKVWFRYPVHVMDDDHWLDECKPAGEAGNDKKFKTKGGNDKTKGAALEEYDLAMSFDMLSAKGEVTLDDIAMDCGVDVQAVKLSIKAQAEKGGKIRFDSKKKTIFAICATP